MGHSTRRDIHQARVGELRQRDPGECIGPNCSLDARIAQSRHVHGDGDQGSHAHAHHHEVSRRRLTVVLAITAAFMFIELIGGWLANSLALLADAAHMLTDVAALALSLFVLWFARRPAHAGKTYGYLRLEILAALINGVALVAISGAIFWQAYQRLRTPEPVEGGLMLVVAAAGLLVNLGAAILLHSSASHNLNVRGAYLHVLGDLVGSAGVIIAAIIIIATGYTAADPIISIVVGLLILFSSWKLVRESVDILLEAVPAHIDLAEVRRALDQVPGVADVHDLHVWTVTSGYLAMSGHAVVQDPQNNQRVLQDIHRSMREKFGIAHITVQLERPG